MGCGHTFTARNGGGISNRPCQHPQYRYSATASSIYCQGAYHVDAVSDCELLELVLSSAPCAVDANALAIRLLERFGTLNKVMHADGDTLRAIEGVDDAVLKALAVMRLTAQRMVKSEVIDRPVIQSWSALMNYCKLASGHKKVEEFRVLFLNHRHVLITDEVMQRGTINHTPIYPREIVKRALELSAAGIILVHNHPSGDCTPSKADIDITIKVIEAAASVNVAVHDHVIVTEQGHYSFKSFGLLRDAGAVAVNAAVAPAEPTQVQLDLF
jgi:DNA repair protein RadC